MPRVPLIEDLSTGQVPAGSNLLVEYDSASQWYNASLTIAAGWLKTGGICYYDAMAQPPDYVRTQLGRLGLELENLEREKKFDVLDWYTLTLGQKSGQKLRGTLKIPDLSIQISQGFMREPPAAERDTLEVSDDESTFVRFNDEKTFVEFVLTREFPDTRARKNIFIVGVMAGIHSDWVYKRLEGGADGVIEFKLDRTSDPPTNLVRITSMRSVGFDGHWHILKVAENFEVMLEK